MSAKKWFFLFLASISSAFIGIFVVTYTANPYGLFQYDFLGTNDRKIWGQEYALKAREIVWQKPDVLFLGTSRTRIGLAPETYEELTGETAYNAGLSGANFHEQYAYFLHALHVNPELKRVVIGLDMGAFSTGNENKPVFVEKRLQRTDWALEDVAAFLFSKAAVKDSARLFFDAIFQQERYTVDRPFLRNGRHEESVLLAQHRQLQKENPDYYLEWAAGQVAGSYGDYELSEERLQEWRDMVAMCEENHIELIVFFAPIHAIQLEGKYQAGLADEYTEWKGAILSSVPSAWDFMGYNTMTTKPVEHFAYYFDMSHYRKNVGDLMLKKMLAGDDSAVPDDFGVQVTTQTVDARMKTIQKERRNWQAQHPELVRKMSEHRGQTLYKTYVPKTGG